MADVGRSSKHLRGSSYPPAARPAYSPTNTVDGRKARPVRLECESSGHNSLRTALLRPERTHGASSVGLLQRRERRRHMEIQRVGSKPSVKGPADWFTGTVRIDPLFDRADPARVSGASVTFEPGARTAWH